MTFTAVGDAIPTHRHTYDHVLQVQQGQVRVWSEGGGSEDLQAPAVKMIPAGVSHDLEALTPAVACCIHQMRDSDGHEFPFAYQRTNREVMDATARM